MSDVELLHFSEENLHTGVQIFFGKMQKLNIAHFGAPFLLLL